MDSKKLCPILRRKVNSALKEKNQSFPDGSKLSIAYKDFSSQTYQHIFKVTVSGIKSTFFEGVGFPMAITFSTLKELGCYIDGTAEISDNGDTYMYTYVISNECAEKLLNP